jgi:hypothetical protein
MATASRPSGSARRTRRRRQTSSATPDGGDPADGLYELPLADFTRERDRLTRELRREGRRGDADRVHALRKPTASAWALNQLARRSPAEVEKVLAAGEALRTAQEDVMAGRSERDRLREASEAERDAIGSLVDRATELLAKESRKPSAQVVERIRETLHAAAGDDQVRELLAAGRLVEDAQPGGFGPAPAGAPASPARPRKRSKREDEAEKRRKREEQEAARRRREQLKEARTAAREAERRAKAAAADLERARDELARLEEESG